MKDIILDVDTGIDDALALILAGHLVDDFRIAAVTTVAGNVDFATATENTRAVLGLIRRVDVPVAAGAAGPLVRPLRTATTFHGARGLGPLDVATLDVPRAPLVPESAAELIARTARERPGQISLIATGPLTNVALALKMDTALAGRLAEIVIMGGAIEVAGNASPLAEANFLNDPEAAQIVLAAGITTVLVPLDVTEQVAVTRPRLEALRAAARANPTAVADFAIAILDFYLGASEQYGRTGCSLHDPLAVLLAARSDFAETVPLAVQIATSDPLTVGHCVVDRRPRTVHRPTLTPNVHSCVRVRVDACREQILASFLPGS
jgi:purine nucleosidase